MKRIVAGIATTAVVAGLSVAGGTGVAFGAESDGQLTVTVVEDYDLNAKPSADDVDLDGVHVVVTDANGDTAEADTVAGVATVDTAALADGAYRVEVQNPDAAVYTEARIRDDRAGFTPAVSFVDLSDGADAEITVGYVDVTNVGPENGTVFSAIQDNRYEYNGPGSGGEFRDNELTEGELYSIPVNLDADQKQVLSKRGDFGNIYGIAAEPNTEVVFLGAYAKRFSAYGQDGAYAIYRFDTKTGQVDPAAWTIVPHENEPTEHRFDDVDDFDFRSAVGREGLGDLEVSRDGRYLTAANLGDDTLVTYDIAQNGANPMVTPVDAIDCAADWTPFGLTEEEDGLYVGATCGESMDVFLLHFDRAEDGSLENQKLIGQGNAADIATRDNTDFGANQFIDPLCSTVEWHPWTDDLPRACIDYDDADRWSEAKGENDEITNKGAQIAYPQPMLVDMAHMNDGTWVFSFRDRGSDRYMGEARGGDASNDWKFAGATFGIREEAGNGFEAGEPVSGKYVTSGDTVRVEIDGDALVFPTENDFADTATTSGGDGVTPAGSVHEQGSFGGIAYIESGDLLLSNMLDANTYFTQGLRVWRATEEGPNVNGDVVQPGQLYNNIDLVRNFSKNSGLADIEVMVRETTQQIGNRLWIDSDRDGVQDAGEQPVEGVIVRLYDSEGNFVAETTTDENGEYYFDTADGVQPLTAYEIRIDPEAFAEGGPLQGYIPTTADQGDDALDSDGVLVEGVDTAAVTTGGYGVNDHSVDFGFVPVVSIGDYLWFDADGDGQQDADELPVPEGTVVILRDADGTEVARTTTDGDGYYAFTDLIPGTDYTVEFPREIVLDDGRTFGLTEQGAEDVPADEDSNPDRATGLAPVTTPEFVPGESRNSAAPGETDDPTIDAGYTETLVSIGDYVWFDEDGDGQQGDDERPLGGITVNLLDEDGNVIATTETDEDGYYVFPNLPTNTPFIVEFPTTYTDEDGRTYGLTDQGTDPASNEDSNANPEDGRTVVIVTPPTGENSTEPGEADDPTIDAGYSPDNERLVSIGDYVWLDTDGNGQQDDGEAPLGGITVTLLDEDGNVVATTETDDEGYYVFPNLPTDQDYIVQFPTTVEHDGQAYILTPPSQGDAAADSNPDADGNAPVTTPAEGSNGTGHGEADDPTIDAGYRPVVSIGDYVWFDEDGDGVQDEGEKPAPNVPVVLYDGDGNKIAETETDENGYYAFPNLTPGEEYQVEFPTEISDGDTTYPLTPADQGDDDAADSDADPSTGRVPVTAPETGLNSVEPGQADDPTIDAGYAPEVDPTVPPVTPEDPENPLPATGGNLPIMAAGLAAVMLFAGAVLLGIAARRRREARQG